MSFALAYYNFSFLFGGIGALIVTLFVFIRGGKRGIFRIFRLLTLMSAGWSLGFFGLINAKTEISASIWRWVMEAGSILIPAFWLHFVLIFLQILQKKKKILIIVYLASTFLWILNFSEMFVPGIFTKGMSKMHVFNFYPVGGIGYYLYFLFFCSVVIYSLIHLFKAYKKSYALHLVQIKYLIFATIFGFGGGGMTFLLTLGLNIPPIGVILFGLYPVLIAYAIIRHRLLNIRLVITRSLLFSILVIVVSSVFTLAVLLARQLVDITDRSTLILVNVIVAVIVVLFLNPLRNFLANQTDRIFFKGQVDHQEVARRLTDLIAHLLERDQLLYQFVRQLKSEFKLKKAEVLFCYNHSQACSLYYSFTPKKFKGTASPEIKRHLWNEYQHLISFFRRYPEIKVREEEARKLEDLKPSLYQRQLAKAVEDLERRSIAVVVPTLSGHKERAFIFLGDKSSGDIFDNRDIRLLELLRSQLTSALEKSGLYEEVKAFSAELEKKVEAATLGLRQANQRLRQLDKAKTLFLSIASHQLRTPLAGIKGFLSMVLEEDFGHLPPKIKQILSEVYANTNKLIRLVNTFLNVSRIESGRLSILKMKCDLVAMTKRIVDELQFMAQDKELKLSLETSHDQIIAEVDADKLEDVLINLIDNAIKYTVRGSIVVRLIDQKTTVRFAVQDTGQGLTKAESQELFNKFVRGSRAMTLNTDGSGLGLYIAKRITEMHKGKIGIESKGAGKGTTFWFELPKK